MNDQDRTVGTVTAAILMHAARARMDEPAFRSAFLWRLLAVGALGGALAVLIVCLAPVTHIEAAAIGAGLPLVGMVLGGLLTSGPFPGRPRKKKIRSEIRWPGVHGT